MKRSQINNGYLQAKTCFEKNGWALPPDPRWDVADMGLGKFDRYGLDLINLAEDSEYCNKLMYARKNQITPAHCHKQKKEDIICRNDALAIRVRRHLNDSMESESFPVEINGTVKMVGSGKGFIAGR